MKPAMMIFIVCMQPVIIALLCAVILLSPLLLMIWYWPRNVKGKKEVIKDVFGKGKRAHLGAMTPGIKRMWALANAMDEVKIKG